MSQLQAIADRLRSLAQDASPLSANVQSSAGQLNSLSQQVESLTRLGVNTGALLGAIQQAHASAVSAADAVSQVRSEGVAWANHLARGGGSGSDASHTESHHGAGRTNHRSGSELSEADKAALADYTGDGFIEINSMIRGYIPFDQSIEDRAEAVSRALKKLPDYQGQVLRGCTLRTISGHGDWQTWTPGAEVRVPEFFSADVDRAFRGDTVFLINSKHGKSVRRYSTNAGPENEVVFDRTSRFRVHKHIVDPDSGLHTIHIEEL